MVAGLTAVRERMVAAAVRSHRDPAGVTLVAVSKGRSVDEIMRLYDAGHRIFGENRAQELVEKAALLPADVEWHFVGSLQRRKVALARPVVSVLHSLDRQALVDAWAAGRSPAPRALLQVNMAGEAQKHGAAPADVLRLVEAATRAGIDVAGLMVIPPAPEVPEDSRRWFTDLRRIRDDIRQSHPGVVHLSMGMTDDFEVAVEEGATLIRVGRAIFDAVDTAA